MKAVSSTNREQRRSIWTAVRDLSISLFSGNRSVRTVAEPESKELSLGEFLLDNMEGDFGYVAAVEDVEELLFQTELLATSRDRLFVSSSHHA